MLAQSLTHSKLLCSAKVEFTPFCFVGYLKSISQQVSLLLLSAVVMAVGSSVGHGLARLSMSSMWYGTTLEHCLATVVTVLLPCMLNVLFSLQYNTTQ